MILHPGILALLSSSVIIVVIMLGACWYGIRILIRWNPDSSSEEQLQLERKTWLVSSLLNYALFAQIVSAILFVFTADDIHRLFVGAMCATGALNANLVGWLVLLIKGGLLFCASIWVVFNRLDQKTEDSPLVKKKYLLLLLMTPLVAFDLYTQWLYFTGLQPEVITSCCGSLFTAEGEGVAAELAALPAGQAMTLFFFHVRALSCFFIVGVVYAFLAHTHGAVCRFGHFFSLSASVALSLLFRFTSIRCRATIVRSTCCSIITAMWVTLFMQVCSVRLCSVFSRGWPNH